MHGIQDAPVHRLQPVATSQQRPAHDHAHGVIEIAALHFIDSCLGAFLLAERIERALGDTAQLVITRLLGVLLAALSVQFVADGILAFLA
jgi:small neutral amino acid transporter SnatA (MarC family)